MPAPSLTYTLSNGTTADASQVMQNFNDLLNGITDGSKDLSISALTCAGNATFNGNVTFGNATSDTITPTGRFAASLIPTTASTYDLGSSSLPFKHIFLDNSGTDGGTINFDAGTSKYFRSNAAGTDAQLGGFTRLDLGTALIKRNGIYYEAKTAAYVITDGDGVSSVLMATGGSDRAVTLPDVSTNAGRVIDITKTDSADGAVIVTPASGTIFGASTYSLHSQHASLKVMCDGTNWIPLATSFYTGTWTPSLGTLTNITGTPTLRTCRYMVFNNMVFFTVGILFQATSAGTDTVVPITTPVTPIDAFSGSAPYRAYGSGGYIGGGSTGQYEIVDAFASSTNYLQIRSQNPVASNQDHVFHGAYSLVT